MQIATAFGYQVVGVDIGEERLDFVKSLGAHTRRRAPTKPSRWCSVSSAASTPASCSRPGWRGSGSASSCCGPHGLFVAVGLPPSSEGNLEFNPFELFMKDPTIIYSAVGTVQDMRELVELAAAGRVKSHVSRVGALSDLDDIFDDLEASRYLGRAVINDLAR